MKHHANLIRCPFFLLNLFLLPFWLNTGAAAASGNLDPTFDTDGTVVTVISGPKFAGADYATAMAHAIQPNGMIVVAGTAHGTNFGKTDFLAARYYPDGSLDTSFGDTGTGVSIVDFGAASIDYAYTMAVQADGKIVAAGTSYDPTTGDDFALIRYQVNGTLDTSFGNGGKARADFGAKKQDTATAMAVQADGKIVIVGYTDIGGSSTNYEFALARFNTDGTLDTTFGSGGKVKTSFGSNSDWARAVVIQADGKIIVGGGKANDFALARYNINGSLDTTFDGDGKAFTSFGTKIDTIYALRLQADGKIVAAGAVNDNGVGDSDIGVARFTGAGQLDTTFDGDGKVVTQIGTSESASGVVIQGDGKIVVAGTAKIADTDNDFALVRYNINGGVDTAFGKNGVVTTPIPGANGSIGYGLALDGDGKFVMVGATDIILARYLSQ